MTDTQAKASDAILTEWMRLRKLYPKALGKADLVFNGRLKSRLGQCKFRRAVGGGWQAVSIEVARFVLNEPAKAMDTFLHEVAHAIAGREANHGPEWKRVARSLGCNAERCGSVAKEHRPAAKYHGTCGKCGHVYRRHRKAKSMGPGYTCGVTRNGRKCGGGITWTVAATGRPVRGVPVPRPQQSTRADDEAWDNLFGWR